MKVKPSIKGICPKCHATVRKGRRQIRCVVKRHNQRQG